MSASAALCDTCQAPAPLKCTGCFLVSYCGKQHQRADWPRHRTKCRAYQVRTTPELGRHLVASRDLHEDELIITECPFVVGPRHFFISPLSCVGCCRHLGSGPAVSCPECRWPACSQRCPGLSDSAFHKVECQLLKTISRAIGGFPYHVVMALRCLLLQTQNPENWKWIEDRGPYAEAGKEDSQNDRLVCCVQALVNPLTLVAPNLVVDCSPETVRRLLNVLDVNALDGTTGNVDGLSGLYLVSSLLQNSCTSNTSLFFDDVPESSETAAKLKIGRVTVKAVRNIRKGEILTRSSGYVFYPTLARLGSNKLFRNIRCSCVRCKDPYENGSDFGTLRCTQCSGWIVPINTDKIEMSPWRCDGPCERTISAQESADLHSSLSVEMKIVMFDEDVNTHKVEAFLSRLEVQLHTNHHICFAVKCLLLKLYGHKSGLTALNNIDLERKAALGRNIVDLMMKLGPPQIPLEVILKAESHMELAKAEAELLKRRFSSGAWGSNRVLRAVSECCSAFRRILSLVAVNPSDPLESHYDKIVTQVGSEKFALRCWLKKNGLKVPGD